MSVQKRIFDLAFTVPGLLLLFPLFLVISILIALEGGGSILFFQERVGFLGKRFQMLKFRTMVVNAESAGGQLTIGRDPRITRLGRWLRKTKLDELPQLLNVLKGEMSLVGPRPEVPRYVNLYTAEQQAVLQMIPGITDPASVKYRNENEVLAQSLNPEKTYIEKIMPEKIDINLHYAAHKSIFSDFMIVLKTFGRLFT
jgi:lipopolysaccharide/colanic/teichoic acid biosynthesis glycosyltransferase